MNSDPSLSQPSEPAGDRVMFLTGSIATSDGAQLPANVLVERICNASVRQQVYASPNGSFSMELGSRYKAVMDASADGSGPSRFGSASKNPEMGIPRHDLSNCELRASTSGFRSNVVSLMALDSFAGSMNVGSIVVERLEKVQGLTISVSSYKTPKDARKAYERGLDAKKNGNLAVAQQSFEKAVKIYPKFTNAWFQLGGILQTQNDKDAARAAYTQATKIDTNFLPPYLSLSHLAYDTQNWTELLDLTGHILALDPLNYARVKGYILDLDSFDYAEAYFYHAVANLNLNHIEDAEKSALKAATLDVRPRFPQIHLLLAEIFVQKNATPRAISELQIYLDQAPNAANADKVRARLLALQSSHANLPAPEPVSDHK
jgi:tetratricopeptide (TPR) repeat protein